MQQKQGAAIFFRFSVKFNPAPQPDRSDSHSDIRLIRLVDLQKTIGPEILEDS